MDAQQRAFVCAEAIPFDASANTAPGTREYELFKQLYADPAIRDRSEPWGLLSWKFEHKAPVSFSDFHEFCRSAFDAGADCAFINPMIGNEAVYANGWEQGIHCAHTGIEKVTYFLEQRMGIRAASVSESPPSRSVIISLPMTVSGKPISASSSALALLDAEAARGTEVGEIYSGSARHERDPVHPCVYSSSSGWLSG